jgi:hypothetical protein
MPQFDRPMRDADLTTTDPRRDQKPRRGRPPGTGCARGPAQRAAGSCTDARAETKPADSPAGAEATVPACASVRSVFTASLAIRHGAGAVLREALRQTIVNCFSRRGARLIGNLDALRIESINRDLTQYCSLRA